jgi:hypothetical protein
MLMTQIDYVNFVEYERRKYRQDDQILQMKGALAGAAPQLVAEAIADAAAMAPDMWAFAAWLEQIFDLSEGLN